MDDIYFTIKKVDGMWKTEGKLEAKQASDVMDMMMILMTNAVRIGLGFTDIHRSLKPYEKAMQAQIKEIIKAEAKEVRAQIREQENGRADNQIQEDAKDVSG